MLNCVLICAAWLLPLPVLNIVGTPLGSLRVFVSKKKFDVAFGADTMTVKAPTVPLAVRTEAVANPVPLVTAVVTFVPVLAKMPLAPLAPLAGAVKVTVTFGICVVKSADTTAADSCMLNAWLICADWFEPLPVLIAYAGGFTARTVCGPGCRAKPASASSTARSMTRAYPYRLRCPDAPVLPECRPHKTRVCICSLSISASLIAHRPSCREAAARSNHLSQTRK